MLLKKAKSLYCRRVDAILELGAVISSLSRWTNKTLTVSAEKMSNDIQPLIVCMENNDGEKVSLRINPADSFQTFLDNAKTLLGYDIDLDSVTNNQPVSLEDNIYTFLLNMEDDTHNRKEDPLKCYELEYVLGDGTQIEASQIQFDNEDTIIDLSAVHIPFVKYVEGSSEDEINFSEKITTVNYVIPESPQSMRSSTPKSEFVNSLPFKLHCSNASHFEMYFNKYLELSMNTSTVFNAIDQKSKNDFKLRCNTTATNQNKFMTRDDILNIFKDSPVKSLPCEESKNSNHEKRKHVRKTDPLGQVKKNSSNKVEAEPDRSAKNYECCICDKMISNVMEKSYIFDKEDQMIHRTEQRKTVTHLKILCTQCLCNHFQPSIMKSPSQSLNNDEYLVIQNNQQFIFQKTTPIVLKKISIDLNTILSNGKNIGNAKVQQEINKEITSSFKGNAKELADVIVDTENRFSDAIEIIEPDIDCDNIDKIEDEVVMEFLGKNEKCDMKDKELICRFCDKAFENISQVVDHGDEHKHNLDDGPLYPCPLCDYGYAKNKWLKCHIKAVHHKVEDKPLIKEEEENKETLSREPSPVAKRTRSSIKNSVQEIDTGCNEKATQEVKSIDEAKSPLVLITEVKQEILDSSDEEAIWIVQAETEAQGNQNKQTSDKVDVKTGEKSDKEPECNKCLQILSSTEAVKAHKCRKRERKRNAKVDSVKKPQKKKGKSSTEPRIVTCDICDESFSSRVRLKFHMQFHELSANITADGEYLCSECDGATFPSETQLFDHVHFQHKKKKRWQCPREGCGKTFFMRTTLTKHIRTHTDTRRYVCVTCGKRFLNKQTLDEHSVTHLQIKPFSCHICLKQLTRRSRLRMHLRSHEEEPSPRLVLACAVCRRAFATATEATEHVTMSTECLELFALEVKKESETEELSPTTGIVTQYSGNKSYVNDPIEREVNTSESAALLEVVDDVARAIVRVVNIEKAFRCEYCEDVFYLEDALNKHRTIHKGVKNPFICHICKVSFATYSRCTTHKTTHGFYKRKEKDVTTNNAGPNAGILGYGGFPVAKHFLCEDCGRSYLHWTYLQVHRRMKHDNQDVLFQCNDCKSTFPNSWSVAYHRKKVHGKSAGDDGIAKIKKEGYGIPCRDCDQLLANKNALYKHRLKEHSDQSLGEINTLLSEEKCMTCGKCGLQVQKLGDLEKHLREVHDDEQQMFSYDAHASTQGAGERRYRCEFCGVSFNRAATMRNHRQIHSGLIRMKWSCERCPRRFSARAELRAHLHLKHPARLAVIEIEGLNPSPEIVLNYLKMKNIQQRNVIDITMISFAQGTTNIVPNSARALSLLNDVPRTHIAREDSTFPRGHGIMQAPRPDTSSTYNNNWPSIIRPNTGTVQDYFSIRSTNDFANFDDLSQNMSAELLLQDGGPIDNRNQEVQINPGDDAARIK